MREGDELDLLTLHEEYQKLSADVERLKLALGGGPLYGVEAWRTFRAGATNIDVNFRSISTHLDFHDDFISYPLTGDWVETLAGTGVVAAVAGQASHPGIISLSTGTGATDGAILVTGGSPIHLGGGEFQFEAIVMLEDLGTALQDYKVWIGLRDAAAASDAIRFTYNQAEESGNWRIETIEDTNTTSVSSRVAVAADTWYRLRFVVNPTADRVEFFVNDAFCGLITTNVPNVADPMNIRVQIDKSAGVTPRLLYLDAVEMVQEFTVPR